MVNSVSEGLKGLEAIVKAATTAGPQFFKFSAPRTSVREMTSILKSLRQIEGSIHVPAADLLQALADNVSATPTSPVSRTITADQEAALRAAGSFVDTMPPVAERASTTALQRTSALIANSLSTDEAAARLNVTAGRVRQRLTNRTLLAVKVGSAHRLPVYQFIDDGELPGWERVAPAFPITAHPTAVAWFMNTPHPDLTVADEAVSPSQWLTGGGDPKTVVDLITTAFVVHAS